MKLSQKYLLVSLAAIVLIPLIVGNMLYNRLKKQRLDTIAVSVDRELAHLEFALGRFFEDVRNDLQTLALHPEVRTRKSVDFTSFLNADERTFEYDYSSRELEIIRIFNDLRTTHPYINSVYMGREDGSFVRSHPRAIPTKYDPRDRPWYHAAMSKPGEIVRTSPYTSVTTPDVNLGIVTTLQDSAGEVYGVVGMDVTLDNLTKYISGCKVGRNGEIVLADSEGVILACRDTNMLFKHVVELIDEKSEEFLSDDRGSVIFRNNGGFNYLYYRSDNDVGLKVGIIIPDSQIDAEIRAAVWPTILEVFVGIGLVIVILLFGLSMFVLKPLAKLTDSTSLIRETGDLQNRVDIKSKDEFGELARSFNSMIESLLKTRISLIETENELIEHQENLEALVEERTSELAENYAKLRKLEKLRDDLTGMIIHDMRTPLMGISASIEFLKTSPSDPQVQNEMIAMLDTSASELNLMVNTLLDVTRLEQGEMPVDSSVCDIDRIIERAIETMRPVAVFGKIEIQFSGANKKVIADDSLTHRVLCNLLGNAIKFSPAGEKIRIDVEDVGEFIAIEVHDNGPGISEEHRELIFEKFTQVITSDMGANRSVGLGLTFCKMAVEAQGGEISVHGEAGWGSIFRFTLPRGK